MYVESSCPLIAYDGVHVLKTILAPLRLCLERRRRDVRTQEEVAFRNQAPMKLGKHRLNTCHAYIAITLAGIINILDTEAVLMTLV